jgi:hypothetical protein
MLCTTLFAAQRRGLITIADEQRPAVERTK